jgi:hypothetical protein
MILVTHQSQQYFVNDEQAGKIAMAVNEGAKLIAITNPRDGKILAYIAAGSIAEIRPGGEDPNVRKLPPPERAMPTPEQIERGRVLLAEGKRKLQTKLAA